MKRKDDKAEPFPDPPGHLSDRSKDLWRTLGPTEVGSIERLTLFQAALESLDRADEARRTVAIEGMTFTTKGTGAVHVHPLLKTEREMRSQFTRIWDLLNLRWKKGLEGF